MRSCFQLFKTLPNRKCREMKFSSLVICFRITLFQIKWFSLFQWQEQKKNRLFWLFFYCCSTFPWSSDISQLWNRDLNVGFVGSGCTIMDVSFCFSYENLIELYSLSEKQFALISLATQLCKNSSWTGNGQCRATEDLYWASYSEISPANCCGVLWHHPLELETEKCSCVVFPLLVVCTWHIRGGRNHNEGQPGEQLDQKLRVGEETGLAQGKTDEGRLK